VLDHVSINEEDIEIFVTSCSHATKLKLCKTTINQRYNTTQDTDEEDDNEDIAYNLPDQFPNIKFIDFNSPYKSMNMVLLELVSRATNLIDLKWYADTDHRIEECEDFKRKFSQRISTKCYQQLENFQLTDKIFDDHSIATELESISELKKLYAYSEFQGLSHRSLLKNHFNSIQELDFTFAYDIKGGMIQEILSKCPMLESFKAIEISGSDFVHIMEHENGGDGISTCRVVTRSQSQKFVKSDDWICLNLKILELRFEFAIEGTPQHIIRLQEEHAIQQLSKLKLLERLNLNDDFRSNKVKSLDLRLESRGGLLERLKPLKNISYLRVHSASGLGDLERQWIRKHWKRDIYIC
jgi:hypothetical protein